MQKTNLEIFIEKNAGLIISFCVFFTIFTFMFVSHIPIKIFNEPKILSVDINLKPAAESSIPKELFNPQNFEPAKKIEPESENPQKSESVNENYSSSANFTLNSISPEEMQKQKDDIQIQIQNIENDKKGIKKWLEKQGIASKGKEHLMPSDGKSQGVIRTLDLKGFPKSVVAAILAKYHIRITTKYIKNQEGLSYLNQADLGQDEIYYNKKGEGIYEVFELAPFSVMKMTTLEIDEMKKRKLIPHKTRIREVHFGIIKNLNDEFDLGIVRFEYDTIP